MDILFRKTVTAMESQGISRLVLGGGVSANSRLRELFSALEGVELRIPAPDICTDNGTMTAYLPEKILESGMWRKQALSASPNIAMENGDFAFTLS